MFTSRKILYLQKAYIPYTTLHHLYLNYLIKPYHRTKPYHRKHEINIRKPNLEPGCISSVTVGKIVSIFNHSFLSVGNKHRMKGKIKSGK